MPAPSRIFLQGPAGAGKTTYATNHLSDLLVQGVPASQILILVPQRTLGYPYQSIAAGALDAPPGDPTIVTLSGLARRSLERFWPLVAGDAGFDPAQEPVFLTIETAQFHMMRLTREAIDVGAFDSISLPRSRIAAQLLDNMAKAAVAGFPFSEVADRLCAAWGDRQSARQGVYRISQQIGDDFRTYCRAQGLLDYALQLELFTQHLVPNEVFRRHFRSRYHHLIADNIEEMGPVVHDFMAGWDHWRSVLYIYDSDGGYRVFLGADPDSALALAEGCDVQLTMETPYQRSEAIVALETEIGRSLSPIFRDTPPPRIRPTEALQYVSTVYYPQMVDWVAGQIIQLVELGVPQREIVVLAPFLGDSLRFALETRLHQAGIRTISHRPSRAIRDEPASRALLTLLLLAHPDWPFPHPPASDVANALSQVIDGLDPVRASLLTGIVYKPRTGALSSFAQIRDQVRDRITYLAGGRYERLREWLDAARDAHAAEALPPDVFLSRLFGEVLSQPGFSFHGNLDAGRICAQMIESARKFRQVLYPYDRGQPDWNAVGEEYLRLVDEGVLSALYTASWRDEEIDAVLLAPAFTFLMRNRPVDFQFWLDIGANSWWERLDQPLTHPYVLTREYPPGRLWTEQDEVEQQQEMLYRTTVGLLRRCRKQVFLGISELNEQGYEQRGPLLYLLQQILQRYSAEQDTQ